MSWHPDHAAALQLRALRVSIAAGVLAAGLGIIWGLASGSRAVLFDGVFSLVGIVMSTVSLIAAKSVERGLSPEFPYGRESFIPLTVGMQGIVRLGISAYAVSDAVSTLRDGGDDVPAGSVVVYSAAILVMCLVVPWWLTRIAPTSDLVALEATGWRVASFLAGVMVVGFGAVALWPESGARDAAIRYVDPTLVIVSSLIVLPVPLRLLRGMLRELLEMAPVSAISEPAHAAILRACSAHGLHEPIVRLTKTGGKLYVEVTHLVPEGTWDVSAIDRLRSELRAQLVSDEYDVWLNVDLTCDPGQAAHLGRN